MGREATCRCTWGTDSGRVVAHLDGDAVSVRGAFRARAPRSAIRDVAVRDDALHFTADAAAVVLQLDAAEAAVWAKTLTTPPPTLAKKFGITPATRVAVVGTIDDAALAGAIATGTPATTACDLLVIRTDDGDELEAALDAHAAHLRTTRPVWVVATKGRNAPLGEAAIREALRSRACIDTKVAAVSARLTAMRFVSRASSGAIDASAPRSQQKPLDGDPASK